MKKVGQIGKLLFLLLLLSLLVAIIYAAVLWARTPRYNGQSIHYWFARAEQEWTGKITPDEMKQVENAFDQMGTAALPFLLEKFTRYDDHADFRRIELLFRIKSNRWIPQPLKDLLPDPSSLNAQNVAQQMLSRLARRGIFAQAELETIISRPGPLGGYIDFQVFTLFDKIGEKASNSAPIIARSFSSTNAGVKASGLRAFVSVTPPTSPHATLLRDAVASGEIRAAHALLHFDKWGLPIHQLLPRLGEELCSSNGTIHSDALFAIKRLGLQDQVLLPWFPKAIIDLERRFRAQLLQELRLVGPSAAESIPHILPCLDDDYSYVRVEAIKTLQAVRPNFHQSPELLAKIKSKLNDPVPHVAETAQAALDSEATAP